jgi:hypothetical protein
MGARVAENDATGTVGMVREGGEWKVFTVMYNIGAAPDASAFADMTPPAGLTAAQRDAWRRLQERGFPRPSQDFLIMSAGQGDLEAVKLFLAAGFALDAREDGQTALEAAVRGGQAEVSLFLIDAGADLLGVDAAGNTLLIHAASECGMTEVLRVLLARGALTDPRNVPASLPRDGPRLRLPTTPACSTRPRSESSSGPRARLTRLLAQGGEVARPVAYAGAPAVQLGLRSAMIGLQWKRSRLLRTTCWRCWRRRPGRACPGGVGHRVAQVLRGRRRRGRPSRHRRRRPPPAPAPPVAGSLDGLLSTRPRYSAWALAAERP